MKKLIYKSMLNAGWARDDANAFMQEIDIVLSGRTKITSANVDPKEVNVKFENGTRLTYKEVL